MPIHTCELKLRFGVRYFNLDGIAIITHRVYASHLGIAFYLQNRHTPAGLAWKRDSRIEHGGGNRWRLLVFCGLRHRDAAGLVYNSILGRVVYVRSDPR